MAGVKGIAPLKMLVKSATVYYYSINSCDFINVSYLAFPDQTSKVVFLNVIYPNH